MIKLKNTKSALWMIVILIVASPTLPIQAAIKQHFPTQETINLENPQLALSWGDIWDRLRRKKGRRGSRGDDEINFFCTIAPGKLKDTNGDKTSLKVWSTKPIFLWKGKIKGIEVLHILSNKSIWNQRVNPKTRSLIYQGEPLQPGEAYIWRENIPDNKVPSRVSFRIMKAEERDTITEELNQLESDLEAKGANLEEIIIARMEYFAEEQLWSDVFQQLYSVKNPSPKLKELIQRIESHDFCSDLISKTIALELNQN